MNPKKLFHNTRNAIKVLTGGTTNNASLRGAREFLKYGNQNRMTSDWSQVIMADEDNYTGYMYGAIDIRAIAATKLGEYNLMTKATKSVMEAAKKKDEIVEHPYIPLIEESDDFSDFDFWYENATYLDLKGVAYILAIRNIAKNGVVGKVQSFKILSPYNVQRIFDTQTGELIGYKEYKGTMSREIPVQMIIPIIKLNPFNKQESYSMTDAAKDHQFTVKTASDYTRAAIRNNQNAPGIISTDAVLEGEELKNFKARVMGRVKGEPLFGGGAGSIKWQDMQQDLNKAALTDVNSISLQNIIAVSGASKTMLGIEESGTTRDTSIIQKGNFIEYRAMPSVQKIIDALNQDYKKYYKTEYQRTKYKMFIDNPLGSDREAEQKDVQIRKEKEELYTSLVNKGYDREQAAKYADGQVTLAELGEPKNPPKEIPETPENQATILIKQKNEDKTVEEDKTCSNCEVNHQHTEPGKTVVASTKAENMVDSQLLGQTTASLQNAIINIDNRVVAAVANKIGLAKNAYDSQDDVIPKKERNELESELEVALLSFYGIIMPLYAKNVMSDRLETYGKTATFKLNNTVKAIMKDISKRAAASHINTTLDSMVKFAQKEALAGKARDTIARDIINKYGEEVSKSRAALIAQTEANRAFTMSQYEADKQFIKQNGFEKQAYKQWVTRSSDPCSFCVSKANEAPIPFGQPFAVVGEELTANEDVDGKTKVTKMTLGFADAEAGNLHPRCQCTYELIIRDK